MKDREIYHLVVGHCGYVHLREQPETDRKGFFPLFCFRPDAHGPENMEGVGPECSGGVLGVEPIPTLEVSPDYMLDRLK